MKKERFQFRLLLVIGLCIAAGFLINYIIAVKVLSGRTSVIYDWDSRNAQNQVYVTMNVSKEWEEPMDYFGAEYDFVIINGTSFEIRNWAIVLPLSVEIEPLKSEDFWNARCVQGAEELRITSLSNTSLIEPGQSRTFGMIVTSKEFIKRSPITISYDSMADPIKLPSFPLLVTAAFVWSLFLVKALSELNIKRKAHQRAEQDRQIILQSMSTFVNFIDAKDPYTKGHSQRVAAIAVALANRLGLDPETVNHVFYAGLLHDSGKISVPDHILKKVGILTSEEYAIMQTHPTHGGEMLKDFTSIEGIREGALYHHERFDGKGYPSGLKGLEIPLFGRIICVADTYDAMARDRCYRKHLDKSKILSEFRENSGTQFDPEIAKIMIEMIESNEAEKLTADL